MPRYTQTVSLFFIANIIILCKGIIYMYSKYFSHLSVYAGLFFVSCGDQNPVTSSSNLFVNSSSAPSKGYYETKREEIQKKIPSDVSKVTCNVHENCLPLWKQATQIAIAPGNHKKVKPYLKKNSSTLNLAQYFINPSLKNELELKFSKKEMINAQVLKLVYKELKEKNPEASFKLAVVEKSGIKKILKDEKLQRTHRKAPSSQLILIMKTQKGSESFIINSALLYNKRKVNQYTDVFNQEKYPSLYGLFADEKNQNRTHFNSSFIINKLLPRVLNSDLDQKEKMRFLTHFALSFESEIDQTAKFFNIVHSLTVGSVNNENLYAMVDVPDSGNVDSYDTEINVLAVDKNYKYKNITKNYFKEIICPRFEKYTMAFGSEDSDLLWKAITDKNDLYSEIAASMKIRPTEINENGFQYSELHLKTMKPIVDQILNSTHNNFPILIAALPITLVTESGKTIELSLYRVKTAKGKVFYVDNTGSYYHSIKNWKYHNELPKGTVTYFKDGKIQADTNGKPILVTESTENMGEKIRASTDAIAMAGVVVVGGGALVLFSPITVPAGAAALIGGVVSGGSYALLAYGTATGLQDLHRRVHQRRTLSFSDPMARSVYINLVSSVIGFGLMNFSFYSSITNTVVNNANKLAWLTVIDQVIDTVAFIDSSSQFIINYEQLTPQQRMYFASQAIFWSSRTAFSAYKMGGIKKLYSVEAAENMFLGNNKTTQHNTTETPDSNQNVKSNDSSESTINNAQSKVDSDTQTNKSETTQPKTNDNVETKADTETQSNTSETTQPKTNDNVETKVDTEAQSNAGDTTQPKTNDNVETKVDTETQSNTSETTQPKTNDNVETKVDSDSAQSNTSETTQPKTNDNVETKTTNEDTQSTANNSESTTAETKSEKRKNLWEKMKERKENEARKQEIRKYNEMLERENKLIQQINNTDDPEQLSKLIYQLSDNDSIGYAGKNVAKEGTGSCSNNTATVIMGLITGRLNACGIPAPFVNKNTLEQEAKLRPDVLKNADPADDNPFNLPKGVEYKDVKKTFREQTVNVRGEDGNIELKRIQIRTYAEGRNQIREIAPLREKMLSALEHKQIALLAAEGHHGDHMVTAIRLKDEIYIVHESKGWRNFVGNLGRLQTLEEFYNTWTTSQFANKDSAIFHFFTIQNLKLLDGHF